MHDGTLSIEEASDHYSASAEPPASYWANYLSARQITHKPVLSCDLDSQPPVVNQTGRIDPELLQAEIDLRSANIKLAAENKSLMQMIAKLDALIPSEARFGEQCDETHSLAEAPSAPAFPSRALRFSVQRIGLFTPY